MHIEIDTYPDPSARLVTSVEIPTEDNQSNHQTKRDPFVGHELKYSAEINLQAQRV